MIPLFKPDHGPSELKAVARVLKSGGIGEGQEASKLLDSGSKKLKVDRRRLDLTTSCTEALFQICRLLPKGREVILPSVSFLGAANAVISAGLTPVFCDVDPVTHNIRVEDIDSVRTRRSVAIIAMHYGGHPFDYAVVNYALERNLFLIEDNACSPLSSYKGKYTGTGGDFGAGSFDPMKILAAGDGALIYSKDLETIQKVCTCTHLGLGSNGLSSVRNTNGDSEWGTLDIQETGNKAIINDIMAAISRVQLRRSTAIIKRRKQIFDYYVDKLSPVCEVAPLPLPGYKSSYYYFGIKTTKRNSLATYLKENNIYSTVKYYPLHMCTKYKDYCRKSTFPNTDKLYSGLLNLPLHSKLYDAQVNKIVSHVKKFLR